MDIPKFYDSAQRSVIYKMFTDIFKMEKRERDIYAVNQRKNKIKCY